MNPERAAMLPYAAAQNSGRTVMSKEEIYQIVLGMDGTARAEFKAFLVALLADGEGCRE